MFFLFCFFGHRNPGCISNSNLQQLWRAVRWVTQLTFLLILRCVLLLFYLIIVCNFAAKLKQLLPLCAFLAHACFSILSQSHFSTKHQSVRSDCCWCKLQIFFQCSLRPRCLYSQPAQQPPQSFSPNLITCFICTSLYFNQGWLRDSEALLDPIVHVLWQESPCWTAGMRRWATKIFTYSFKITSVSVLYWLIRMIIHKRN